MMDNTEDAQELTQAQAVEAGHKLSAFMQTLREEYQGLDFMVALALPADAEREDGLGAAAMNFFLPNNVPGGVIMGFALATASVKRARLHGIPDAKIDDFMRMAGALGTPIAETAYEADKAE